jgi:integrase
MARERNRLTALRVKSLREPGRYADGGGLYLFVGRNNARVWVFRYRDRRTSKHRDRGLGPVADVPLEKARERAAACRALLLDGVDPIDANRTERLAARVEHSRRMTFAQCASAFIDAKKAAWRNEKHREQWTNSLKTHAAPLMSMPVAEIDTPDVLGVLNAIWATRTETATRVRGRIENILDWARVSGFRTGENPARWKGHLKILLAPPTELKAVEHHPALPYIDMPAFIVDLRKRQGVTARALELQILTAARPGEIVGAQWSEFDLDAKLWTIPASRMKANREHRVPLSEAAVALLSELPKKGEFVFAGAKPKTSLSIAAPLELVKELRAGFVPHGFRSTFRDWAADRTSFPRDVAEAALAHTLKDKAEAAYRRSDLFDKRRKLMDQWAKFVETPTPTGNVSPIKRKAKA